MSNALFYGLGDCKDCQTRRTTRLYPTRRQVPKVIKCDCGGRAWMNTIGMKQRFRGPGGLSPRVESERKS